MISKRTEYEVCTTAGVDGGDYDVALHTLDEKEANARLEDLERRYPNSSSWISTRTVLVASMELREAMLKANEAARKGLLR